MPMHWRSDCFSTNRRHPVNPSTRPAKLAEQIKNIKSRRNRAELRRRPLGRADVIFSEIFVETDVDDCPPWFAVYVKAKHEKTVATMLSGKGHEIFLPTYRRHHKRSKHFDLPLFPGYVFCRFEVSKTLPVISTPGVLSIVGNGRTPQPISEDEIESVRRMMHSGLYPCPWPYVAKGHQVCLTSGPLRGLQGLIVDTSQEKWLVVSLDILRRSVAVKLDRDSIVVNRSSTDAAKPQNQEISERTAGSRHQVVSTQPL